jgi:hypothetical protein
VGERIYIGTGEREGQQAGERIEMGGGKCRSDRGQAGKGEKKGWEREVMIGWRGRGVISVRGGVWRVIRRRGRGEGGVISGSGDKQEREGSDKQEREGSDKQEREGWGVISRRGRGGV